MDRWLWLGEGLGACPKGLTTRQEGGKRAKSEAQLKQEDGEWEDGEWEDGRMGGWGQSCRR